MKKLSLLLFFLLTGCAAYRVPTCHFEGSEHHPLYCVIPRHRSQIKWYDAGHWITWGLFGNDDDGIFGECTSYRCEQPNDGKKALAWGVRNPLHNFTFYVIGTANQRNSGVTLLQVTPCHVASGCYTPQATTVFPSQSSCFYLALHGWKPFLSWRLVYHPCYQFDFYLGWRCRGNFGLKFQPAAKRKMD